MEPDPCAVKTVGQHDHLKNEHRHGARTSDGKLVEPDNHLDHVKSNPCDPLAAVAVCHENLSDDTKRQQRAVKPNLYTASMARHEYHNQIDHDGCDDGENALPPCEHAGIDFLILVFFLTIKLALPHLYADELHGDVEDLSEDVSDEMVHDDNDQPSGATDEAPQIVGQSPTVDENEIEHDA